MSNNIIVTKNLSKTYRKGKRSIPVLFDINLNITKGNLTVIHGPSGSGKTTLLNIIGTIDQATEGYIEIAGQDISKLNNNEIALMRSQKISFVFQSYNLINTFTLFENIALPMQIHEVPDKVIKTRVEEICERVGLKDYMKRRVNNLSGGQQQRAAMARALVNNSEIVIGDEPTANLDSENAISLITLIKELQEAYNTTFIISSHDDRIIKRADDSIEILDGKIKKD